MLRWNKALHPTRLELYRDCQRPSARVNSIVISLRADEGRAGQKERLREAKIGDGRLAPVRQKSFSSPKWEAIRLEEEKAANDLHEATQSISESSVIAPGVLKAEKCLIAAMLSFPTWRGHILERLPLAEWTDETHGEIVIAARKYGAEEEITPVDFSENLSEDAQKVVGDVMLSDEAGNSPDAAIVDDWIARVEMHWARQTEIEMLELVNGKIGRGETVSDGEKAAFVSALEATRRKMPVPEKWLVVKCGGTTNRERERPAVLGRS